MIKRIADLLRIPHEVTGPEVKPYHLVWDDKEQG